MTEPGFDMGRFSGVRKREDVTLDVFLSFTNLSIARKGQNLESILAMMIEHDPFCLECLEISCNILGE